MFLLSNYTIFTLCFLISLFVGSHWAFDDEEDHFESLHDKVSKHEGPPPKDKILLKDVKTLTFQRNKKTTSKRTHSIHQLSCVGGTAGCKLFTPNVVECENTGFNHDKNKFDWKCHAEISDRVRFNHVEVICEGYDYPEDDYILLGSCGLEFTLDYTNPHDYHDNSYFKHLDEHEKEMHHERVRATAKPSQQAAGSSHGHKTFSGQLYSWLITKLYNHPYVASVMTFLIMLFLIVVRFLTTGTQTNNKRQSKRQPSQKFSNYGPLSSAVLTTKKAC